MLRDEEVYPEPAEFKPERFMTADGKLNPDVQDPADAVFGFASWERIRSRRCWNHISVNVVQYPSSYVPASQVCALGHQDI